jgi:hypothetical protein
MSSPQGNRRRLLIIHHADENRVGRKRHLIHLMIPVWKEAGIEVTEIFGVRNAPPADVAFLHVDLSVVPRAYLELARRYPVTVNKTVADIRKSHLSVLRVNPGSGYAGPVIVKSALNCAGDPEMVYFRHRSKFRRLYIRKSPRPSYPMSLERKEDYRIFSSPAEVPASMWECADLVIEKFKPEQHDGLYCLREWYFCGDKNAQRVELSPDPIFTSGTQVHHLDIPVPPELQVLRKQLGFDYGKFDYTMVDGKAVPFDFNKTSGVMYPIAEEFHGKVRKLARGLDAYFI